MSSYEIFPEQKKVAKKMKLMIYPSDNPKKKLDVYDTNGLFLKSIGDSKYNDYYIYKHNDSRELAQTHKLHYFTRHRKGIQERQLGEILSWCLLWDGLDEMDKMLGHEDFKPKKTIWVEK